MSRGFVKTAAADGAARLLGNRDFTLLWSGAVLSELGSQATNVALPLLVLVLTHSPAQAGLTGFARMLGYALVALPAGVLADRVDRRRLIIACALVRALAMASVAVGLAVGRPPFAQLLVVALADSAVSSVAAIAERGLLPEIVASDGLADAVAFNEARVSVAVIGGPPLGGALFGLARTLPFLADTTSFLAAALSVVLVRARPREARRRSELSSWQAIREGTGWLWHQPFLRAGSLFYAAANLTLAAVELLAILVARHHGASSAAIGVAFAIAGLGGLCGAGLAGPLRRRVRTRVAVLAEAWTAVLLVPCLLLCRSALAVGVVVAGMFLPMALSSSVVVGQRLTHTPEPLRGRVQASASFISASIAWAGPLAVGVIFQSAGETAAVLALSAWTVLAAGVATLSGGLAAVPGVPRSG